MKNISRTIELPRTTIERKFSWQKFLFRILAKILARFLARIYLGKILARFLPRFLPRSWQDFSWQDLGKILGKILVRFFLGKILPRILARSCQDLTKILPRIEIGTILARPHEVLPRSWQDLAKVANFFCKGKRVSTGPDARNQPHRRSFRPLAGVWLSAIAWQPRAVRCQRLSGECVCVGECV